MKQAIAIALFLVLLAAFCGLSYTAWDLHQTEVTTRQAITDLDAVLKGPPTQRLNDVIGHADMAFKNLANATGDWSDASKQQARDVRALLAAGGRAVDAITEDARTAKGTIAAGTDLTQALTVDARTANSSIAASRPLLEASTQFLNDADRRVRDPEIDALLANIKGISDSGNGILADARQVADHETREFLKPVKWYMRPVKRAGDLLDISAAIARHTP